MSLYIPQVVALIHNYSNIKEQAILSLVCATFYRIIHNIRLYTPKKSMHLFFSTNTGYKFMHLFYYNKLTTIKELRESLKNKNKTLTTFDFIFQGKKLKDEEQFCKFKFQKYACIHLITQKIYLNNNMC